MYCLAIENSLWSPLDPLIEDLNNNNEDCALDKFEPNISISWAPVAAEKVLDNNWLMTTLNF